LRELIEGIFVARIRAVAGSFKVPLDILEVFMMGIIVKLGEETEIEIFCGCISSRLEARPHIIERIWSKRGGCQIWRETCLYW